MRSMSVLARNELSMAALRPVVFYEGEFQNGTLRLWTGVGEVHWGDKTWYGAGTLLGFSAMEETSDLRAVGISVTLSGVSQEILATALSQAQTGKPGKTYLGFLAYRDNFLLWSENLSNANWTPANVSVVDVGDGVFELEENTSSSVEHKMTPAGAFLQESRNRPVVASAYVKCGQGTCNFGIRIRETASEINPSPNVSATPPWVYVNGLLVYSANDFSLTGAPWIRLEDNTADSLSPSVETNVDIPFSDAATYTVSIYVRKTTGGTSPTFAMSATLGSAAPTGTNSNTSSAHVDTDTGSVLATALASGATFNVVNESDAWKLVLVTPANIDSAMLSVKFFPVAFSHGQFNGSRGSITGSADVHTVSIVTSVAKTYECSAIFDLGVAAATQAAPVDLVPYGEQIYKYSFAGTLLQADNNWLPKRVGYSLSNMRADGQSSDGRMWSLLYDNDAAGADCFYQTFAIPNDSTTYTCVWNVRKTSGGTSIPVKLVALLTGGAIPVTVTIVVDTDTGNVLSGSAVVSAVGSDSYDVSFSVANNGGNTDWDDGATDWDNGLTDWDVLGNTQCELQVYPAAYSAHNSLTPASGTVSFAAVTNVRFYKQTSTPKLKWSGKFSDVGCKIIDDTDGWVRVSLTATPSIGAAQISSSSLEFLLANSSLATTYAGGSGNSVLIKRPQLEYSSLPGEYQPTNAAAISGGTLVPDPILSFEGRLDVPQFEDSGNTCTISISYESEMIDLERPRERRWTNDDQHRDFPGDKGFEYMADLPDRSIVWGGSGSAGPIWTYLGPT